MQWEPVPKDAALSSLQLPPVGSLVTPAACKDLALLYALRGLGQVAPNPLVGAVVVDAEHRFLAAGAHERVGQAHAEVNALTQVADLNLNSRLKGGTLYCTLEPCAHANRTPACAPRVAASGVAKVVYGLRDPNPKVDGRGAAILREAGVGVELDQAWTSACEDLTEVFLWQVRHRSPFVAMKVAISLDGLMALPGSQRAWITGERARSYGHFLRVAYDGIIVGRGTLLADDPQLDARASLWPGRAPTRIVLDPDASGLLSRPPDQWRLLSHHPEGVLWLTGDKLSQAAQQQVARLVAMGARHLTIGRDNQGLFSPHAILQALGQAGLTSVLLEGGAGVYGPFLRASAVQRLYAFQAPKILGAGDGLRFAGDAGEVRPARPPRLTPLGDDWLIDMPLVPSHQR